MRNFSKTLISMAAVMAVGSAMAAGAMAADLTIGKDTVKTDGKISISGVTADKSQYTLLVVQGTTAEGATEVTYDATEATIKQIDQNDAGVAFTEAVVGTDLADGDYKVMVGNNDGTVDTGYFTLSSAPQIEYESHIIGDVDANSSVDSMDLNYISCYAAYMHLFGTDCKNTGNSKVTETNDTIIVGDVDGNSSVDSMDLNYVSCYAAYMHLFGTDCKNTGNSVNVQK